jgi:hypothetical protein
MLQTLCRSKTDLMCVWRSEGALRHALKTELHGTKARASARVRFRPGGADRTVPKSILAAAKPIPSLNLSDHEFAINDLRLK